ncbi:hypothetical protein NTGBS_440057 [Candidatus Nitrotoga sp. BS]|nr:hypothetical protein NTGBS_440057 [Candidatus Nitrotoga sp. BS]
MRGNRLRYPKYAFATVRTVQPLDARHPPHERFHRFHHNRVRFGRFQRRARSGQVGGFVRGAEQAVVADTLETTGQHVLHKTPDELARFQTHHLLAIAVGRRTNTWPCLCRTLSQNSYALSNSGT